MKKLFFISFLLFLFVWIGGMLYLRINPYPEFESAAIVTRNIGLGGFILVIVILIISLFTRMRH
jgi:small-conductance mechanosensitive channel